MHKHTELFFKVFRLHSALLLFILAGRGGCLCVPLYGDKHRAICKVPGALISKHEAQSQSCTHAHTGKYPSRSSNVPQQYMHTISYLHLSQTCTHTHRHLSRHATTTTTTAQQSPAESRNDKFCVLLGVGVCVRTSYFIAFTCLRPTARPLVCQSVCECIYLGKGRSVWRCEHAYVSVSTRRLATCVWEKDGKRSQHDDRPVAAHSYQVLSLFLIFLLFSSLHMFL